MLIVYLLFHNHTSMSDKIKVAVLTFISENAAVGVAARLSFTSLTKTLNLPKAEMEECLTELNKERFISQYSKKGVDGFNVLLNQKGEDAVQDESL